jgi:hypothetical protein
VTLLKKFKIDSSKQSDSRYRDLYRLIYSDGIEMLETQNRIIIPKSVNDTYYTVVSDSANRLDLISYNHYGTPLYWWVIAYASNIMDPMTIPVGTVLRIPPLSVAMETKR